MNVHWKPRGGVQASVGIINAVEFDPDLELLWVSDSFGRLMSFTTHSQTNTLTWTAYSSFLASTRPLSGIFFLPLGGEKIVTVADHNVIRGYKRGGALFLCRTLPPQTQDYIELFQTHGGTGVVSFTGNVGLTRFSIGNEGADRSVTVPLGESKVVALHQTERWIVTGSTSGSIVVRDSNDLQVVDMVPTSRHRVLAMDAYDDTIVAAVVERSMTSGVRVYDVRKMAEPVIAIGGIPSDSVSQVRRYRDSFGISADRAFVLTSCGFHIVQMDQPSPVFSSNGMVEDACTSVSVSPNGMCAAIGNDKGYFIALAHPATREDYVMSRFEKPQRPVNPVFTQSWAEKKEGDTFAFFDETVPAAELASNWPPEDYMILSVPAPTRCLNVESRTVLQNRWGFLRADSYLPDPKDKITSNLPDPFPFNLGLGDDPAAVQRKLQDMKKDQKRRYFDLREGTAGEYAPLEPARHVCYSSHHRFDWEGHNAIPRDVVGLDNSFPECWITTLLQSLYLCHPPEYPVRKVILRHLCTREYCIACETSFIFSNMLMTSATGLNPIVQVANLIRTMYKVPATASLFEPVNSRDEAVKRMHTAQLVLLEALHRGLQDEKAYPFMEHKPPCPDFEHSIAYLFGTEFSSGGRVHLEPQFYWDVPSSALKVNEGLQHLLKQIESYRDQVQIKRLPPIIVLRLNPEGGTLKPPRCLHISREAKEDSNYVLCSSLIHLSDDADDPGRFVIHQRILDNRFSLVNDYRVTAPMEEQELEDLMPAFHSHRAVVAYYALDKLAAPPYSLQDGNRPPNMFEVLGPLLLNDTLAKPLQRDPSAQRFKSPLASFYEIKSNDLVALDAEYVVLNWSSRCIDAGLENNSLHKTHMALARLSCILSSAPGDERTIVDDYVHTPEVIEDYVTQYSGIHPGDLDPLKSSKCLTSRKATYLKLRALVDRGVVFVGHGLYQDFRVCNIAVPAEQIIDTLMMFHKPGGRYLSLRFLAYHVLGERVQEGEHDSVEDARTSLRLYRKYQQLVSEGTFDTVLDKLLATGAETSWYVPEGRDAFGVSSVAFTGATGSPVFPDAPSTLVAAEVVESVEFTPTE
ncbi:putative cysteine peptidase, Clan CA, family C19 [Trypanosoma rangeli]|uniref:Putative cysteine peptidase, Clan CA, family C19 n=1 Tax=Trypanosoma rangeli TaxID=5698 RepID=A0A3R7M0B3_TRYRA|nr:putative cysteine peptidase, Clan CA, family C19 [Trypanosoma rangeli]RNF06743.1 putative cysteine peptidase, Clan CA, family C19 [Trypanosoma rangeli]|eukprot:RNF06743.1 putative cysteine peptidase, Clan CA, family C19 [Trypanosoma rangeli]